MLTKVCADDATLRPDLPHGIHRLLEAFGTTEGHHRDEDELDGDSQIRQALGLRHGVPGAYLSRGVGVAIIRLMPRALPSCTPARASGNERAGLALTIDL